MPISTEAVTSLGGKRKVETEHSVFIFGCESWSLSWLALDSKKKGETNMMRIFVRFTRQVGETRVCYCCRERAEFRIDYNFVHKFILMPQAMKIPDAKAAVDKEWEKLETIPAWGMKQEGGHKRCKEKQH